ncbi:hypothetical protein P409_05355 [Inquilinus limosus MP06]|uniref:Uncharacterized protein n=1 Tax=Inquilinus limosus MP06 TaxID=1398085 RepID=A0A0A0DBA0_9PROT|nr:hypothetical protein P409_05355 [Inquilinus limosus MP06]
MQVQHDLAGHRQAQQPGLQPVGGGDHGIVTRQQRRVGPRQPREAAVEVDPAVELVASLAGAVQPLLLPDRVGPGHDGDVAADVARRLGPAQPGAERVEGDDAGQLLGMQRRLEIGGRPAAAAAEAQHRDPPFETRHVARNHAPGMVHTCPARS